MGWNTAVRVVGVFPRFVAALMTNVLGFKLGSRHIKFSQFDSMNANPLIVPSLPELTAGYPTINGPRVVMAGMYDHPALAGASLGKSDKHEEIMKWLDTQQGGVLYVAFGSEIVLGPQHIEGLLKSFQLA